MRTHRKAQQLCGKGSGCGLKADNKIGVEGARALGDALNKNTTLTELDLCGEQQDHKDKHNGMRSAWTANWFGDEEARSLAEALKTNATLTELDLWCEQQDQRNTSGEQGKNNCVWSGWQ